MINKKVDHYAVANIAAVCAASQDFSAGSVIIAGFGEGGLEQVSLGVLTAVRRADVIFHDSHCPKALLELAPSSCKVRPCGKRVGRVSPGQEVISEGMIAAALAGGRVLRLKGGDPLIFSRLAEEITALGRAGIKARILPGVSSAQAAMARLKIPFSSRDTNQQIIFATGRDQEGALPEGLDWRSLSAEGSVNVFFMAGGTFNEIAERMLVAGADPESPVVVVERLGLAGESHRFALLSDPVAFEKVTTPALIITGEVVRLAEGSDFQFNEVSGKDDSVNERVLR